MSICKETKWLCENAKTLEKYSGQWIVFNAKEGLVNCSETMASALKFARPKKSRPVPFLFHVPSREDLDAPLPVASKK